jgi:spermidine synthase
MAGLGVGSWIIGKFADRLTEDKLARIYLGLEFGIAAYALFVPVLLRVQEQLFVSLHEALPFVSAGAYTVRAVLAFALFIIPTSCMGATLPVLSRYIIRRQHVISTTVSKLYGLNTLGAAFGVALAGFILLPAIGNFFTNIAAVSFDASVALGFWMVHRTARFPKPVKVKSGPGEAREGPKWPAPVKTAVIISFALSGFTGMLYEISWTRTLVMVLGTTTYAFSTMLATFILGLAIGSILYKQLKKLFSPLNLVFFLHLLLGFTVLASIPLFDRLPFAYLTLFQTMSRSWISLQFIRFLIAVLVMVVPTISLGCLFPAVSDILVGKTSDMGTQLGKAYGFNTFGAVAGTVCTSLLLIPAFGMQTSIILGGAVNLTVAVSILLIQQKYTKFFRILGASAGISLFALTVFMIDPWAPKLLNSGVYIYADRYLNLVDRLEGEERRIWKRAMRQYSLLYYDTGVTSTVAVMERDNGVRFMTIDGKTDAGTGMRHDMKTQVLLGQLPMLFHKNPEDVFLIGLGSGITAGSILTHNSPDLECAEISSGVIEAAEYFSAYNHRVLENRRLRIIPRDARNYLLTSDKQYDVVVSQPSNPWIDGQSILFTQEWYRMVKNHLGAGGLFIQWIPAYQMSERDVKTIIYTMKTVFPHTTLWTSGSAGDIILLSCKEQKLSFSYDLLLKKLTARDVYTDIARLGFDPELLPLLTFFMEEEGLEEYLFSELEKPLQVNSDDFLITEYSTPKHLLKEEVVEEFQDLETARGDLEDLLTIASDLNLEYLMGKMEEEIEEK